MASVELRITPSCLSWWRMRAGSPLRVTFMRAVGLPVGGLFGLASLTILVSFLACFGEKIYAGPIFS